MKPKLFVVSQPNYALPFKSVFDVVDRLDEASVVMFTGGEDVNPALYGERKGSRTHCDTARDVHELQVYRQALSQGKRFLGICRGAQFLCVMAGGKLIQHTENHNLGYTRFHRITTNNGEEYNVNTLHHQMMYPKTIEHKLLAWAERMSPYHLNGDDAPIPDIEVEPEVVYFPTIRALGIQCHPEFGFSSDADPALSYLRNVTCEHLL